MMRQIIRKLFLCERGFSLFESMFALCIASVLFGCMVIPIRTFMQKYIFLQNVNQIVSDIQQVQQYAVVNSQWCRLSFLTTSPAYFIYYGTQLKKWRTYPPTLHYQSGWISLPSSELSFDGTGGPSVAGTLRLQDDSGHQASIVIYLGSGIVFATIDK